jgi:hypothetical protein
MLLHAPKRVKRATFLPDNSDAVIFSLGLHDTDVEAFLFTRPEASRSRVCAAGETGVYECVSPETELQAMPPDSSCGH